MAKLETKVNRDEPSESWNPHRTRAAVVKSHVIDGIASVSRTCKECGGEFWENPKFRADFCCKAHQAKWKQRRQKRGLAIIDDAMRYRRFRKDKTAFGDLCAKISAFIDEDKANGRPSF